MARDPILFYDEVPLYESELDDNGVASLSVKVCVCKEQRYRQAGLASHAC